jgi:hypothetical protein
LDGEEPLFITGKDVIRGNNILRDSRVMLSIDGEHPPFAFVLIEGEAVASELPPAEHLGPRSSRAYGSRAGRGLRKA